MTSEKEGSPSALSDNGSNVTTSPTRNRVRQISRRVSFSEASHEVHEFKHEEQERSNFMPSFRRLSEENCCADRSGEAVCCIS
mmetsp:Transcript_71884/g.113901  ORF Transcript_71884/g.113901 Transcript_71884/m.113901 type:complete len:83 (+) Transcript_71884:113-361(+)